MLKMLTYLVSEKGCSHFSGGSYGGVRSPPMEQEAPVDDCNVIISLYEYFFHNSAHNRYVYTTGVILLAYLLLL